MEDSGDSDYAEYSNSTTNPTTVFAKNTYIWTTDFSSSSNNAMMKITDVSATKLKLTEKPFYRKGLAANTGYDHDTQVDLIIPSGGGTFTTDGYTSSAFTSTTNSDATAHIYQAYLDPCYAIVDVEIVENENSELSLSSYLSKALVYYLKAKFAEDQMDIDAKEYFMKEFRKMIEKNEGGRFNGYRHAVAGSHAIR